MKTSLHSSHRCNSSTTSSLSSLHHLFVQLVSVENMQYKCKNGSVKKAMLLRRIAESHSENSLRIVRKVSLIWRHPLGFCRVNRSNNKFRSIIHSLEKKSIVIRVVLLGSSVKWMKWKDFKTWQRLGKKIHLWQTPPRSWIFRSVNLLWCKYQNPHKLLKYTGENNFKTQYLRNYSTNWDLPCQYLRATSLAS